MELNSYSTISYYEKVAVIPGSLLNGSRLSTISWETKSSDSFSLASTRSSIPLDSNPARHVAVVANKGQSDGNLATGIGSSTMYQRPAL